MNIAVLNDARNDLAERMAMLDIAELNYGGDSKAEGWSVELAELEKRHGFTCIVATLEWYIEKASDPRSVPSLGDAIMFYLIHYGSGKTLMTRNPARQSGARTWSNYGHS